MIKKHVKQLEKILHCATILIKGRIPSKKNSRCLFVRGGRIVNIPSKAYSLWHKDASSQLSNIELPQLSNISKIHFSLWAPDKRAADLSNKFESVADLLVDNKILEDDNWFIVPDIELKFMGIDRKNPHCQIEIEYS